MSGCVHGLYIYLFRSPIYPAASGYGYSERVRLCGFPVVRDFTPVSFGSFSVVSLFLCVSGGGTFFFLGCVPYRICGEVYSFVVSVLDGTVEFSCS